MGKIKVLINWSGNNYCADAVSKDINGVILVTNGTFDGVKKEFESALQFHIEGCLADGDTLPEWLVSGQYELDYVREKIINGIHSISQELASVV